MLPPFATGSMHNWSTGQNSTANRPVKEKRVSRRKSSCRDSDGDTLTREVDPSPHVATTVPYSAEVEHIRSILEAGAGLFSCIRATSLEFVVKLNLFAQSVKFYIGVLGSNF